jgi:hypothetical protein
MRYYSGYRAVWSGTEYDASPDGDDLVRLYTSSLQPGFDPVRANRFRRLVPRAEVTWLGYVRTVGELSGHPVVVLAQTEGRLLVEHLGPWAGPADGAMVPEPGVCWRWVAPDDLVDLRQVRI